MKVMLVTLRYYVLLALLLLAGQPLRAQQVLPLDSVLRAVEGRNPALRQYGYRAQAKQAAVAGARSWEAPKVSAGYWMTPYNQQPIKEMNNGQGEGMQMVSVEQMLPNPAKQRAKREYLAGQAAVAQADQTAMFNQLRAQARSLYYGRVLLEKKLGVLDQSIGLLEFLLKIAQARYPYNQSTLASIYQAQARVAMHGNDHQQLYGQLRQSTIALNTLMARDPEGEFAVDTLLPTAFAGPYPDTAALARRRSDVRSLDRSLAVVRLNQNVEANRRRPDFGVRYDHMNGLGVTPNQFTVMGMVSIPIAPWASREYKANTAALGYEAQAVQQQRASLLTEAAGRITTLQSDLRTKRQQVENFEKGILPALRKNYQVTLLAYQQNTAQLPAVVEALETWLQARLQYLDTQTELLNLHVRYDQELEQ
ncbi:TolC family protein [Microvirga sp. STS02]|uniref:TolC family protein n=1 Tax=Hymenobacter negativus TaxID=2795026 RepID=UPI0018DE213F|nr:MULTISPECIES: TolC family protein [Bacteria]MBH8571374.1 TolC family protein [Hymenobacter negativus]MBR7211112.1 TolC family protein [Microvirga sp. STS02]